jgi:hypothetical protein
MSYGQALRLLDAFLAQFDWKICCSLRVAVIEIKAPCDRKRLADSACGGLPCFKSIPLVGKQFEIEPELHQAREAGAAPAFRRSSSLLLHAQGTNAPNRTARHSGTRKESSASLILPFASYFEQQSGSARAARLDLL